MQVLVTGGLGWTAEPLVLKLAELGHEVIAFDLPGVDKPHSYHGDRIAVVRGDVADLAIIERVAAVCDVIVHMAVDTDEEDYADGERPFATNVRGTYNVLRAARDQKLATVVLMSAAPVHLEFGDATLDGSAILPTSAEEDHLQDLTRLLQETLARNFAATFGLRIVVVRAGHIVDGKRQIDRRGRPLDEDTPWRGGLVCRHDLAAAVIASFDKPTGGRLHVLGAVGSSPGRRIFGTERTEAALGLVFQQDGFAKVD